MRYFTLKVLIPTEGDEVRDLRGFDSLDDALVRFHTDLTSTIGQPTTSKVLCMVLNEDGGIYKSETWKASTESAE